jgi:restriction endonuclease
MARRKQDSSILLLVAAIFFFYVVSHLNERKAAPPAAPPAAPASSPAAPAAPSAMIVGQRGSYALAKGTRTAYNGYEVHRPPEEKRAAQGYGYANTSTARSLADPPAAVPVGPPPNGSALAPQATPAVRPATSAVRPARPSAPTSSSGPGLIVQVVLVVGAIIVVSKILLSFLENPVEFEKRCARKLKDCGWETSLTKASGDQGADIIAKKDGVVIVLQCKLYHSRSVGNKAVQEAFTAGRHYRAHRSAVVTNNTYTNQAKQVASTTGVLLLHDSDLPNLERLLRGGGSRGSL